MGARAGNARSTALGLVVLLFVAGAAGKQDEREKRRDIVDMAFCGDDDCYAILNITADSTRGEVKVSGLVPCGWAAHANDSSRIRRPCARVPAAPYVLSAAITKCRCCTIPTSSATSRTRTRPPATPCLSRSQRHMAYCRTRSRAENTISGCAAAASAGRLRAMIWAPCR